MGEFIEVKEQLLQQDLLLILSESVYNPTYDKLVTRAQGYINDETVRVFIYYSENCFQGLVIVRLLSEQKLTIKDIAVLKSKQKCGIGKKIISFLLYKFPSYCIVAETDDDAVEFYRKCSFNIKSLGEKYPGITRYMCTIEPQKI